MRQIGFLTSRDHADLTDDDRLVVDPLKALSISVAPLIWDDEKVNWKAFDAVIVRSCWDYYLKPEEFRRWLDERKRDGIRLINRLDILYWNMEKNYLAELSASGIDIVPTVWLARGSSAQLESILQDRRWRNAVVKPTISATAYNTWTTSDERAAMDQSKLELLLKSNDVMVQPFMKSIQSEGEWSLVFLGGEYSHAVIKRPKNGDFRVQSDFGGTVADASPTADLIETARNILSKIPSPLLYARVDGVMEDGRFYLMELEIIEPSLFLGQNNKAPERFAQAIHSHLNHS
ncbi:MAG: RimK family alpha-L-glutamate ligase [Bacteroidota bacterium]